MKKLLTICGLIAVTSSSAQEYSRLVSQTAMSRWKDSFMLEGDKAPKWRYDQGVVLKGIEALWKATGDATYFNYLQKSMDYYVGDNGTIKGYRPDEYNIDHVNNGKLLLTLYRVTGKEKYRKAAEGLRQQLRSHPRTKGGSFWHKKVYPWQVWLDGLYMGQPFYAEYASIFGEDTAFNDITRQYVLIERHARDPKTGLLYHGWDESRQQKWANAQTGLSPHVWGRALGWFGMSLVDVLDHFPPSHPGRDSIIGILQRFAKGVTKVQDPKTGLWYDIPNMPNEPKNYVEASASSMLVYTLAKGMRKGYLPLTYMSNVVRAYEGIKKEFIKTENGQTNLHGTVAVSGLGGNPYRDGSFAYYMSEPVIVNDPKGVGAFIQAAVEVELIPRWTRGMGKTVLLDNFFNNEWKKDHNGNMVRWHYTWEEMAHGGFSLLGDLFNMYGAKTKTLTAAPTGANLKGASVYIIVDPDTEKETAKPNFMTPEYASVIADWVKGGGKLLLMANDAGNADLKHTNELASRFGVRFNEDNYNLVKGDQFEQGAIQIGEGNPVFTPGKIYVKELATLQVEKPASTIVSKEGKAVIATANYGKGSVLIIGDPWLYNEYVDGRKLPADFQNFKAAEDLVKWLVGTGQKSKIKVKHSGTDRAR